jgi:hypothetical protein
MGPSLMSRYNIGSPAAYKFLFDIMADNLSDLDGSLLIIICHNSVGNDFIFMGALLSQSTIIYLEAD